MTPGGIPVVSVVASKALLTSTQVIQYIVLCMWMYRFQSILAYIYMYPAVQYQPAMETA